MTEKFRFFVQTTCATNETKFTVDLTGTVYNTAVYNSINVCNCTFIFISNIGLKSVNRDQ